ncbi:MAG: TolC family protein [bacterium]|nr:TolC family protein [bacterium]
MKIVSIRRLTVMFLLVATNTLAQNEMVPITISTAIPARKINLESIIHLTYQINPNIAAAKYDLESAEYAYQEFERELSQFTPLKLESRIDRTLTQTSGGTLESGTQNYSNSIGFQKDYFNGTSFSFSVGHQGDFGEDNAGHYPFIGTSISIPLFSSYQTLSRITWRSFEESQLYTARLNYISKIKGHLRWAQLGYLWFQNDLEKLRLTKQCWNDFQTIFCSSRVQSTPAEKEQIEGELQSLQSDIVELEGEIHSGRIELQANIGCDELELDQIEPFDLYTENFYGKEYLQRSKEDLTKIAIQDDVEIKVLEASKHSAEQKRLLAEKGKWDIFLNLDANYDFPGQGTKTGESGYYVGAAVNANWIDSKLLKLSYNKAEAEIKQYLQQIKAQQMNIKNSVDLSWNNAKNLRKQAEELTAEVESRKNVYTQKVASFLENKETIDNLIQARKKLLDSQKRLANVLTDFYETVTELDAICNVYFQKLKIDIVSLEKKSAKKN